jgi:IS30 family transposase
MRSFKQISYHEREKISRLVRERKTKKEIAALMGRNISTISREINRNSSHLGYLCEDAQKKAERRKRKNTEKISKFPQLKKYILEGLQKRWSPRAIAGRWNLENETIKISTETLYKWIYDLGGKELQLNKQLIRAKKKRGFKRKVKGSKIKNRTSIHKRPEVINDRSELGHYECDLMFNKGSQSQNICTLVERSTRQAILIKIDSKKTDIVFDRIISRIRPSDGIKSITFDNGGEFAGHERLRKLGIRTYFCDPGAPWQKGSIENLNGQIRRYFPFRMKAQEITSEMVIEANKKINDMPRAILGFRTPLEVSTGRSHA